ncbi:MAG: hypothetical protein JRH20_31805 [Deltaproteobacteria bacterium]|nr:hypothetical protein [Deltaproteobacteria bacterium]
MLCILSSCLLLGACSNGDEGEPLADPWKTEEWLHCGLHRYERGPLPPTIWPADQAEWYYGVNGWGAQPKDGDWPSLDDLGGTGTLAKLKEMDTPALRARYAEGLTDFDALKTRLNASADTEYPLEIFIVIIKHYLEYGSYAQIEDPSQHTPLVGAVVLPVGSDPAVEENPELAALIAELIRIHEGWEAY